MNNKLKEFEELLLDNRILKVCNQALGNKNPKWKEWWQIVQKFTEEQIQESMELAHSDEQGYQLKFHAYRIAFLDFKYKPLSFVSMEIGTNIKILATPFVVQLVAITKSIYPLRGGISLEIIPLLVQTFTIHVQVATIIDEHVRSNERPAKEQVKHVDPSFIVLKNKVEYLEFLYTSLPLTPHQIGTGQKINLISRTPHASEVFTTPIATFEETPN